MEPFSLFLMQHWGKISNYIKCLFSMCVYIVQYYAINLMFNSDWVAAFVVGSCHHWQSRKRSLICLSRLNPSGMSSLGEELRADLSLSVPVLHPHIPRVAPSFLTPHNTEGHQGCSRLLCHLLSGPAGIGRVQVGGCSVSLGSPCYLQHCRTALVY